MNETQSVKDAKQALSLIRVIIVLLILVGVFFIVMAAWDWGLMTAATETSSELLWKADTIPVIAAAIGGVLVLVGSISIYFAGKINKAFRDSNINETNK